MSEIVKFSKLPCHNGTSIGLATLNSPATLNALSHEMNVALTRQLITWAKAPEIALVILRGAGEKAFCAGGDIKALYKELIKSDPPSLDMPTQYFSTEYTLDLRIHNYPKPIIVWGNGIVMGGGMGLMQGARRRMVTQTSRLAMPEALIGMTPDVGGSWFLARLPGRIGLLLALSGAALNAHDALRLGLADRAVPAEKFDPFLANLQSQPWQIMQDNIALLDRALAKFTQENPIELPPSQIIPHLLELQALMQCGGLKDVISALIELRNHHNEWLRKVGENVIHASPTAMAVCWEIHHRLRLASLSEVFRSELNVVINFCLQHDFKEGIRAMLIDKDHAPKWQPSTIDEVSSSSVQKYFEAPWATEEHPLFHATVGQASTPALQQFEEMVRGQIN